MNARQIYKELTDTLKGAGIEDAGLEADIMMEQVCGASRFLLEDVGEEDCATLRQLAQKRAQRQPLQYVLGRWPFMDLDVKVGPGVLVPRPETEEVCRFAAGLMEDVPMPAIADLCSGSGAIALELQHLYPDALVMAVELDEDAFGYLLENTASFGESHEDVPVAAQADVLEWHREIEDESYDLIVSNPPYVTQEEYGALSPEVHAEPKQALVPACAKDEQDGLPFYRAIARNYRAKLREGGWLVFEIGAAQGGAVRRILEENGYGAVTIEKDLSGNDRIAAGRREG